MAKAKHDKKAVGALERSPGHLLHRALQLALDYYVAEAGANAATQRQFAVLAAAAEHEGATQTLLVKATGIDRSTLADLAARMITKGLLERERSALDARANAVRLTAAGRELLETLRPRAEAADARILAQLPSGKRDGFIAALRILAAASETAPGAEEPARKKKDKADKPAKTPKAAKAPKAEKADKSEKKKKKKAGKAKGEPVAA
jgi:DNA-binding MarR family transcriptional regulator